jgi:hypothetical protein
MADVNVTFAADTSALDAAVTKVKSETQNLVPGGPGAGVLTPLPVGLGGVPVDTLLARATAAAKQATEAQKEFGDSSTEAAAKTESMTGAVIKLGLAYEAVRVAVKAVTYVFEQAASLQTIQARFNALSGAGNETAASFDKIKQAAHDTGVNVADTAESFYKLQDSGMGVREAGNALEALDKEAQIAGVDAKELAGILSRLRLEAGSTEDMQRMARITGGETRKMVQDYIELQKTIRMTTREQELAARVNERQQEIFQRSRDVQGSFLEKLGVAQDVFKAFQATGGGGELRPFEEIKGVGSLAPQVEMLWDEMRRGVQQIGKEEGFSTGAVRRMVEAGLIGQQDLMEAARRGHDEERRLTQQAQEDLRTTNRLKVDTARLAIQAKEVEDFSKLTNLTKDWSEYTKTEAGAMAIAKEQAAEVAAKSGEIAGAWQRTSEWIDKSLKSLNLFQSSIKGTGPPTPSPLPQPGGAGFNWDRYTPHMENTARNTEEISRKLDAQTAILSQILAP